MNEFYGLDELYPPSEKPALPRNPTRLQVAMCFNNVAQNALFSCEAWRKYWAQYYPPELLDQLHAALKAIETAVNE